MSADYRFQLNEEFLLSAHRRYRRQLWWYQWYRWLKMVAILCLVVLIAILASAAAVALTIGLSALLALFLLAPRLDGWLTRWRFRRSPYCNDDIVARISSDGISLNGRASAVQLEWAVITRARGFRDGLLLFQGPHVFNWLPDGAGDQSSRAELDQLVKARVPDYVDIEPRVPEGAPQTARP